MSNMRATHSWEYNAICDVCRRKFKASMLRKRWDGYMVCKDDWEIRHPSDFYTTPNDVHVLPWTRSDVEAELTWTPTFSANYVETAGTGSVTRTARYTSNVSLTTKDFKVQLLVAGNATTQVNTSATMTLPTTSVSAGTFRVIGMQSGLIGTGTIAASATTLTLPAWTARNETIMISGSYGA